MAVELTQNLTKISEFTAYTYNQYTKLVVRLYAKYTDIDIENAQTGVYLEERIIWTASSSNHYTFSSATPRLKFGNNAYVPRTFGANLTGGTEYFVHSLSATINHNADGTSPNVNIIYTWKDTLAVSTEKTSNVDIKAPKMDRYPILTNTPDFTDESNPVITYTTTLGFDNANVYAGIFDSTGTIALADYREVNVENGSYTFNLTSSERTALKTHQVDNELKASFQVMYKLKTTANNNDYISSQFANCSIINDTATLTYSSVENNEKVSLAVGDTYVKNASNRTFAVNIATKKYNSISKVYLIQDNRILEEIPTTSDVGENRNYIARFYGVNITTNEITIRYVGSRSKDVSTNYELLPYADYQNVDITSAEIERPTPTSNNIKVNLEATYIGTITINQSGGTTTTHNNSVALKYKIENGNYVTISSSAYTIADNKLILSNYEIQNALSYTQNGNIEFYIEDDFTSDTENRTIKKGVPTFDYGEHDFQVNGDLFVADTDRNNAVNILSSINTNKSDITSLKGLQKYSTSEEAVIGTWIDGKTLYRKWFKFSNQLITSEKSFNLSISNYSFGYVDQAFVERYDGTKYTRPINMFDGSSQYVQLEPSNPTLKVKTDMNIYVNLYVAVHYTKSS